MVRDVKKRFRPVKVGKIPVGLRLHPELIEAFKAEADRRRLGYQTLVQQVLNEAAIRWEERNRKAS